MGNYAENNCDAILNNIVYNNHLMTIKVEGNSIKTIRLILLLKFATIRLTIIIMAFGLKILLLKQ